MASVEHQEDDTYYHYELLPARHIRLLRLVIDQSADAEDVYDRPIEVTIETVALDDRPAYNTLSYTWGSPRIDDEEEEQIFSAVQRCYPISCGGKVLLATRNLRDFLLAQRKRMALEDDNPEHATQINSHLPWWIDAICINQEDVSERSSQVAMMADIYKSSTSTTSWLDKADQFVYSCTALLAAIAKIPQQKWRCAKENGYPLDRQKHVLRPLGLSAVWTEQTCYALGKFFMANYFGRAWILQEAVLSRHIVVVCGEIVYDWDFIGLACTFITVTDWSMMLAVNMQSNRNMLLTALPVVTHIHTFRQQIHEGQQSSFDDVIPLAFSTVSSDPLDKVYALLSLSDLANSPLQSFRPDYTRSPQQVYAEVAALALKGSSNLRILQLCQISSACKKMSGLPSWCPDFSEELDAVALTQHEQETRYSASVGLECYCEVSPNNKFLRLRGFKYSIISEALELRAGDNLSDFAFHVQMFPFIERIPLRNPHCLKSGQTRVETFWRTIFHDELLGVRPAQCSAGESFADLLTVLALADPSFLLGLPIDPAQAVIQIEATVRNLRHTEPNSARFLPLINSADMISHYEMILGKLKANSRRGKALIAAMESVGSAFVMASLIRLQCIHVHRKVFRLENGMIGTGTDAATPGDEIWLIAGSDSPLLLRLKPNGRHEFLGQAYVHGIMYGEGLEGTEKQEFVVLE